MLHHDWVYNLRSNITWKIPSSIPTPVRAASNTVWSCCKYKVKVKHLKVVAATTLLVILMLSLIPWMFLWLGRDKMVSDQGNHTYMYLGIWLLSYLVSWFLKLTKCCSNWWLLNERTCNMAELLSVQLLYRMINWILILKMLWIINVI